MKARARRWNARNMKIRWQYDKKVTHDGVTNRFTFVHVGQKVVFKHLSPREVSEDQMKMTMKRKEERKTKSKNRK
ncbi:hypothetical protein CR513_51152, partial [Mucuna pruriens]